MPKCVVGTPDEIAPGQRKIVVPFRGRAGVGVFNVKGSFFALRNLCPHKLGPLCTGAVTGRMVAELPPSAGDEVVALAQDGEIIRCPWHLWEFEIATGRCLVDRRVRVKTYLVTIEDGQLVVEYDD